MHQQKAFMSASLTFNSQEEVADSLIPSIAAKIEPTEDDEMEPLLRIPSSSGIRVQDQLAASTPPSEENIAPATIQAPPAIQAVPEVPLEVPVAATSNHDAGSGTTPVGSPSENSRVTFSSAFPELSPPLEPVQERYIEEVKPLSDDDEDDLPTLENLLAGTRPDYNSQKRSQEQILPRASQSAPVKSEDDVSNAKPRSKSAAPPPRATKPPGRIVIDISDSSPLQPPKTQRPPTSPPLAESSASQARTKRKHTPSLPPLDLRTPPAKRSKTASVAVPAQKHDVHWALDGSIVIQVQDTKFKLHQSHLAKHSPWFSGLFDGQQVVGENYVEVEEDGTTPMYILSLPSLTAQDFTRLLDGFHNAIIYVHEDPSFSRIAGILRAATLLSFPDFRNWAIRLLEDRWSPELADLTSKRTPHATETVLLARSCNVPSILKRAMYELVRLAGYGQNEREGVSAADFRALVRAREQLTSLWMQTVSPYSPDLMVCAAAARMPPADPVVGAALGPLPCTAADPLKSTKAHHKLVHESGISDDYLCDPLCGLEVLIEADWGAEGYCAACVDLRREVWSRRREKTWDNLNIWFGIN
ncbi:hypothetical protein B0H19DRAFT_1375960 [Mycena capillaripes]|nr:hypothetical protein B0H19DRAFT_1375960 [Mycena capillaripes]